MRGIREDTQILLAAAYPDLVNEAPDVRSPPAPTRPKERAPPDPPREAGAAKSAGKRLGCEKKVVALWPVLA
jgi:hypothetical protein